ncbi:MAG: endonuclease III [Methanoregula sp.]|uniref:endonuclease III domain-containing protein n=1 Tax=Methanoregula sp. TaxID=2052170 RepID=UPI003BAFB970
MNTQDARRIYSLLLKQYPDARESPLTVARGTPFHVLILTILSAQTTDKAVLLVEKPLFSAYPTPEALASADIADVEPIIHRLGFYHAKARHIIAAAKTLITDFGGQVPDTMEDLLSIPGVGRKTANIVLYHGFGKNHGIAVDTHVRRLAQRIGFSDTDDVKVIEHDLMTLFPSNEWGDLTDVFIAHGRACCTAKKPQCPVCGIRMLCRFYRTTQKDK